MIKRKIEFSQLNIIFDDLKIIILDQDLANIYCKGPETECFRLSGP